MDGRTDEKQLHRRPSDGSLRPRPPVGLGLSFLGVGASFTGPKGFREEDEHGDSQKMCWTGSKFVCFDPPGQLANDTVAPPSHQSEQHIRRDCRGQLPRKCEACNVKLPKRLVSHLAASCVSIDGNKYGKRTSHAVCPGRKHHGF